MKRLSFDVMLIFLLILSFLAGCTLLGDPASESLFPATLPMQQQADGLTIETTTPEDSNPSKTQNSTATWQIMLKGDPGVKQGMYTHLPNEKLTFIATFSQEMDKESVEQAFQNNLIANVSSSESNVPRLGYSWLNPIQLEITFPGDQALSNNQIYTLSPKGAKNKNGIHLFADPEILQFELYPAQAVYRIQPDGSVAEEALTIPFALRPISQSPNGESWLLGRWTKLGTESNTIPYLYNPKEQRITHILPERWEVPFWSKDGGLYIETEQALIHFDGNEEKWFEFAQYPYLHGWSLSPDQKYEVFLLSKTFDTGHDSITLLVKNKATQEEQFFEDLLTANPPDEFDGGILPIQIEWIPNSNQIYLSLFGKDRNDYLVNIETGEKIIAPDFLQNAIWGSPKWSSDGQYVANPEKGIFTDDGTMIFDWKNEKPCSQVLWHPQENRIAYRSCNQVEDKIIQLEVDTGEQYTTTGNYQLFAWDSESGDLLVYKEESD